MIRVTNRISPGYGRWDETPAELVWRVASNIAQGELNYPASASNFEAICERYYELMASCEFMPNSPTLMNATMAIAYPRVSSPARSVADSARATCSWSRMTPVYCRTPSRTR